MALNLYPWLQKPWTFLRRFADNPPGGIMIHASRGVGGYEFAEAFAQLLLCESPENGEPCGMCKGCQLFAGGTHPDLKRVLSETEADIRGLLEESEYKKDPNKSLSRQITIDQIRDLADFIGVTSHRGGKRVVIIYPANRMMPDASSALLKSLEEPPEDVVMVLVTEDIDSMLPTIRSRCQIVRVRSPQWEESLEFLKEKGVASAESALAAVGGMPLLVFEQDAKLRIPDEKQTQLLQMLLSTQNSDPVKILDAASRDLFLPAFIPFMQRLVMDLIYSASGLKVRYFRSYGRQFESFANGLDIKRLYAYADELSNLSKVASHPLNATLTIQEILFKYAKAVARN